MARSVVTFLMFEGAAEEAASFGVCWQLSWS